MAPLFFSFNFYGVFVRFSTSDSMIQQGEFKNTTKNFLGEVHVKNFWPKKLRGGRTVFLPVPAVCSLRKKLSRFFAVSLHEEPKNTTTENLQKSSKATTENLQKNSKEVPKTVLPSTMVPTSLLFFFLT
jgi:hypothetical protein